MKNSVHSNVIIFNRKKTQHFTCFSISRLIETHCFFIKIPNKRELEEIASNHSSDIDFKIS